MCNNTNYGDFICYSCDTIHHCQGTRCWGPCPMLLPVLLPVLLDGLGARFLPEQKAEPK